MPAGVICVEKPYIDGFIDGLESTIRVGFVLLTVNGGDVPLGHGQQEKIARLPGLLACFANNLHQPINADLFHPLPIGLAGEALIYQIRKSLSPWKSRDRRLLVTLGYPWKGQGSHRL